ncbi:MAG: diaminopimelate epimerase [Acidimicrobiales bacterium]
MASLELAKYEALGNDFLIVVDWAGAGRFDAELAASLCERHRGVGADGLIRLSAPARGGTLRMELRNADGTPAETSGNGLRCAVVCARDAGLVAAGRLVVETEAGDAPVALDAPENDGPVTVHVGMGTVRVDPLATSPVKERRAYRVDAGNPHLVLLGADLDGVDLGVVGPELERAVSGGQNVELAACRKGSDEIGLVVWERGAGLTLACGSGSAAAAAAAHSVGLVGENVVVHNPGGDLAVELVAADGGVEATLVGTARRVARLVVDIEPAPTKKVRVA